MESRLPPGGRAISEMAGESTYIVDMAVMAVGFVVSFLVLPPVMRLMRSKGIVGVDVHKRNRPKIPEMGGVSILIGLTVSMAAASMVTPHAWSRLTAFLAASVTAGLIGAVDDLRPLNAKVKPLLTMLAGVPILVLRAYNPYLALPIVGYTRLTVVYPLLILPAIAVCSNAVNMMDPFNGTMTGTCSIISLVLLISALVLGRPEAAVMSAGLLGSLLALWYFNRYPSRVFVGDVGSLSVGAALGAIAIIGRMEVIAVVSFMPQIMNAFYGLSTIGRLYERREVPRPIRVLEDGRLAVNPDPKAPITLARIILAKGPLTEEKAVKVFMAISAISGALALLTMCMMLVMT